MIGQRIAALRRAKGWSQRELAQQLHVSPSAVGMYEQERRELTLSQGARLAAILEVSLDYLATGHASGGLDFSSVMGENEENTTEERRCHE